MFLSSNSALSFVMIPIVPLAVGPFSLGRLVFRVEQN